MHHNYYLSPLAVALVLGMSSPVRAAEPMPLQKASIAQLKQKFSLTNQGIVSSNSLALVRENTDRNKITHVRMQQQYSGFPVFGGYAIFHSANNAKTLAAAQSNVAMNGRVFTGLETELGKPESTFVKNADNALNHFKSKYAGKTLSEEKVTPMVYIDEQHKAHWAYQVSVFVAHKNKIPSRPTAVLDAKTYQPFVQWDDIKTKKVAVKGEGFGGNHKIGEVQYGTQFPYLELTRNNDTEACFMENTNVRVVDMEHRDEARNVAMKFACPTNDSGVYLTGYQADGYDKENGAASPSNDALYAGGVIKHLYHDWYGVEVLTKVDGSPMQLVMRVHCGIDFANAYWDGRQMTFGDGDETTYPFVSLGVGAHEVSHGFTEQHSELRYYGQSGGMNESFSDIAAQAAEYYSVGKSSWKIGSEIMKEDSGYETLRYMDTPSRDGRSIDTADEYYGGLDVHYSSGVFNRLFYLLATKPNWNPRLAFDVMVKANMDYWTPYSNFEDGGCGMLSAAKDLGYSLDDIKASLKEVAISYDAC